MSIHVWRNPEEELPWLCHATELTIENLDEKSPEMRAEGTVTVIDYIEHGISFTEPWEATGHRQQDNSVHWTVRKKQTGSDFAFIDCTTDEEVFCANSEVNDAIAVFVAQRLNEFLTTRQAVVEPERYTGERVTYTDPCVCFKLAMSDAVNPFLWEEMTGGGKFPQRCFECVVVEDGGAIIQENIVGIKLLILLLGRCFVNSMELKFEGWKGLKKGFLFSRPFATKDICFYLQE